MGTQASKKSIGRRYESWWSQAGSNRRPLACHASALPAELWPPIRKILYFKAKLNLISPKCYRKNANRSVQEVAENIRNCSVHINKIFARHHCTQVSVISILIPA